MTVSYTHLDADEGAALLRKLFVQCVQLSKLAHAGVAGGEPEIHHGDGVGREQLVTFHRISIQVLALKGGEFLHAAVIGFLHTAAVSYTHLDVYKRQVSTHLLATGVCKAGGSIL